MLFTVSYILITGYSILLFMNPLNFVAVVLKVLRVNLLAALNFANVFLNKNAWKIKKTLNNVKNVTKMKNVKKRFLHLWSAADDAKHSRLCPRNHQQVAR